MTVINVKNIHKKFKLFFDKGPSFKEKILFRNRNHYEDRWVLKGIDFTVEKGEAVGLLGQNGCGKSTLLKLMTKIMYPEQGSIEIVGRVSSLIELGAGFHPDMSGRENIYTNASIFGLTRNEIDARLQDIIDFSELHEFIDNPVRTYSSGMYMRLAFSVAINVDADVLLIDEILAVGDVNFQAKCFDKLRELKANGMTIVIVTHDTGTIERFCTQAIWIEDGVMAAKGPAAEVVDAYLRHMSQKKFEILEQQGQQKNQEQVSAKEQEASSLENEDIVEIGIQATGMNEERTQKEIDYSAKHFGLNYAEITKAYLNNSNGEHTFVLKSNEPFEIEIHYVMHKSSPNYIFGMGIYTIDKFWIVGNNTKRDRVPCSESKTEGIVRYCSPGLPLVTGKYILQISITDEDGTPMDFYREYCFFDVVSEKIDSGILILPHRWEM